MSQRGLELARAKMAAANVSPAAIEVFARFYGLVESGQSVFIREDDVEPLPQLACVVDDERSEENTEALRATALIKLNGGLGTSMGMPKAKSLLSVRDGKRFLDLIVDQVRAARAATGARLPVMFMDSFRTGADTLEALSAYPDLPVGDLPLSFMQNREPKLDAATLEPVSWPANPALEWCPPGHGDLYPSLHDAGIVRALLDAGFRYVNVSNADNLGAYPSAQLAGWFARSGAPYAAEMCLKTPADVKGGQLVVRKADGRIMQRETAQTHPDDMAISLDPTRHRYFHTNNLWFDLEALNAELERTAGVLELPLIANPKTVDPTDPDSTPVIQIESAMGAAVVVFEGATAVEVPRSRFLPVKTTNDLLVVRSDVYELDDDARLVTTRPVPLIDLSQPFKTISGFEARFPAGVPSLRQAVSLTVDGDWTFGANVTVLGEAYLPDPDQELISLDVDPAESTGTVPDGATITADGLA